MKIPTLINSSSKINGELIFTTEVRIDGEVFGKVESDKSIIIGAEGYVKGFLRAGDLVVFGRLEGNFIVSGATVLHEKASVFGNLYTRVLEVKEGATITARVVTYDKLEAIDEAQIYLAEEMIKVEPGRRQIPTYDHAQITFEEPVKNNARIEIPVYSPEDEIFSVASGGGTGDILAKIMEHNNSIKEEHTSTVSKLETPAVEEPVVEVHPAEQVSEMVEMAFIDDEENEEDDMFTLLSPSDEFAVNQQLELFNDEVVSPNPSGHTYLLEFDFEVGNNITNNLNSDIPSKSLSIAECLGEPVKDEESLRTKKGKKKVYSSDVTLISQSARKNKVHSLSGFEELRNLLIPIKYQDSKTSDSLKQNDKKNEKLSVKKGNEIDGSAKSKADNTTDLFLNDAIRQLPIDDYSSLFN